MKLKAILFFLLIFILIITLSATEVKRVKNLTLSATDINLFELECGAGNLNIMGVEGQKQLEVKATIVVSGIDEDEIDNFIKHDVQLTLKKDGNRAQLVSSIDTGVIATIFSSKEARIDLDVRIPKLMTLQIEDGSGAVDILNITGNVKLDDGSGSILIKDIYGNIDLEDGSGQVKIENISGNVSIEDGSGELSVKKIGGNVTVDDNSGELSIKDIKGNVEVDDGSGSITIDGVEKDVTIHSAGSGDVSIHNVKGKIKR